MNKINMNITQFKTSIHTLAKKLKKEKVDYIVTLSKGGFLPARYLAKLLKVDEIHCIGMKFYDDVGKTIRVPHIYQSLTKSFNEDDSVLIVDDIVDSGESMGAAMQEVANNGTRKIITCSIHYKPKSTYKPDYFYKKVADSTWVIYDWE